MSQQATGCPRCTHPSPRALKRAELDAIPKCELKTVSQPADQLVICAYCGCVYLPQERPHVLGHFNNPLSGPGWVSKH
jgi:hypothetical protein